MPRAASPARTLTLTRARVRPTFDLSEDDILAIAALPEPFPHARDARIAALLALRYGTAQRPELIPPQGLRDETRSFDARLPLALLEQFDTERQFALVNGSALTRGAFLRAILDAYRKVSESS